MRVKAHLTRQLPSANTDRPISAPSRSFDHVVAGLPMGMSLSRTIRPSAPQPTERNKSDQATKPWDCRPLTLEN